MAAKKTTSKDRKLQVKDLAGKKLTKEQASQVKGGRPKIICLSVRSS